MHHVPCGAYVVGSQTLKICGTVLSLEDLERELGIIHNLKTIPQFCLKDPNFQKQNTPLAFTS